MPKYEFAVHNESVRLALEAGESFPGYEDSWGDTHYIEVIAPGEGMARAKIDRLYPNRRGFVIEHMSIVADEDD